MWRVVVDTKMWASIEEFRRMLDAHHAAAGQDVLPQRLLKLVEELGELSQAYQGFIGANPRKGVTHTKEDVVTEVCDVIIAAAVTLATLSTDPDGTLRRSVERVVKRGFCEAAELPDGTDAGGRVGRWDGVA
jgi:NTP pyrophosphatase (non-canonical NTP hydrolase)